MNNIFSKQKRKLNMKIFTKMSLLSFLFFLAFLPLLSLHAELEVSVAEKGQQITGFDRRVRCRTISILCFPAAGISEALTL